MGSTVQNLWEKVYESAGGDHWTLYIIGSWVVSFSVFALVNIIFGLLDVFGLPDALRQYKVQKARNVPMSVEKYLRTLFVATFNMSVTAVSMLLLVWYMVARHRMHFDPSSLPGLWKAFMDITICALLHEIDFYYLHRLLHHSSFLFKHIHKMHHEWKAPCTMATFYCHPLEHAVMNMGGLVVWPAVLGIHISITWVYWGVGIAATSLAHSGYHLPFLPSPQSHDYHHSKGVDQYGTFGLLDWLHSSNKHFKRSLNCKRHMFLWSHVPVDELVKL